MKRAASARFSHLLWQVVFQWSLSDNKSAQVSRTLLNIVADFCYAVIWIVLILHPISCLSFPDFWNCSWGSDYDRYHCHLNVLYIITINDALKVRSHSILRNSVLCQYKLTKWIPVDTCLEQFKICMCVSVCVFVFYTPPFFLPFSLSSLCLSGCCQADKERRFSFSLRTRPKDPSQQLAKRYWRLQLKQD